MLVVVLIKIVSEGVRGMRMGVGVKFHCRLDEGQRYLNGQDLQSRFTLISYTPENIHRREWIKFQEFRVGTNIVHSHKIR